MRTAELRRDTASPSHRAVGAIVASTMRAWGATAIAGRILAVLSCFLICQGEEQFNLAKTAGTNRSVCSCGLGNRSVSTQAICFFLD